MSNIKLDFKYSGVKDIFKYKDEVIKIHKELLEKAEDENDFARLAETTYQL